MPARSVTRCRMCKAERLTLFLDLGSMPPADSFLKRDQLDRPEPHYPLRVALCEECYLVQLDTIVPPEELYCRDYPYESSITRMGQAHWAEFAETTSRHANLQRGELVVDIGSNVGVLLEQFTHHGAQVLGIDPAANIAARAIERGVDTLARFFDHAAVEEVLARRGPAKVVSATNVVAHVDDLDALVEAVKLLLAPDGVFVIEFPYLVNLVERLEYDTIYHEHLSYLAIRPLARFFASHGMEVYDIQERDIHGGSVRVYVRRRGEGTRPASHSVASLQALEERKGMHDLERLTRFARDVARNRDDLRWWAAEVKARGCRLAAVSAPAKGMTLLGYCGLGADTIDFVTEKSTLKIGRFTPGTHIPVVPDAQLFQARPDYSLLLAWNFAEEIMSNLRQYSAQGGRFVVPIPSLRIVE